MAELSAADWKELAHLWRDLAELATQDVDRGWQELLARMAALTDADHGFVLIQRRTVEPAEDPLDGFRPVTTLIYGPDAEQRRRIATKWQKEEDITTDPVIQHITSLRGQTRAVRHATDGPEPWEGTPSYRLAKRQGLCDRLVGVVPLEEDTEVSVGVDRVDGSELFSERDRDLLFAALDGLRPLAASLSNSYGLRGNQTKLSPREREVLSYLLGPLSEKEIADRIGLATSSTHQVVVAIYRKLGVRSRAELMSRWLDLRSTD